MATLDPEISREVLDSLPTGVCLIDRNGKVLIWNQGAERIAGHRQHEVIGRHHSYVLEGCDLEACTAANSSCPLMRTLHEGKTLETGVLVVHKRGHSVPVLMRMAPIRDARGSVIAVVVHFDTHNASSQRVQDRRIAAPSGCKDAVTGLANQEFTEFHIRENLVSYNEYQIPFGIICVRADRFDRFRSAYGHEAGDAMLHVIAQNLSHSFRPSDFIGRWEADKFIAVLMNCEAIGVRRAFERVHKLISKASIPWWGEHLSLATSLGYAAVGPDDTVLSLIKRAEATLGETPSASAAAVGGNGKAGN